MCKVVVSCAQAGVHGGSAAAAAQRLNNIGDDGELESAPDGQRTRIPQGLFCVHPEGLLRGAGPQLLQQLPLWSAGGAACLCIVQLTLLGRFKFEKISISKRCKGQTLSTGYARSSSCFLLGKWKQFVEGVLGALGYVDLWGLVLCLGHEQPEEGCLVFRPT